MAATIQTVPVDSVAPGAIAASHIRRGTMIIVPAGTPLTQFLLDKLRKFNITTVEIAAESPAAAASSAPLVAASASGGSAPTVAASAPGIQKVPVEILPGNPPTLVVKGSPTINLRFAGKIVVEGGLEGVTLSANADVEIHGPVRNATVDSASGSVRISGEARGSRGAIRGSLVAMSIHGCDFQVGGDLLAFGPIEKSRLRVRGAIRVEAKGKDPAWSVVLSKIEAGVGAHFLNLGEPGGTESSVRIQDAPVQKATAALLEIQARRGKLLEAIKRTSGLIDVLFTLGERVRTLPEEKKRVLLQQEQVYKELIQQRDALDRLEHDLKEKVAALRKEHRMLVVAEKYVYPGVEIGIGEMTMKVGQLQRRVGFYGAGMIIAKPLEAA